MPLDGVIHGHDELDDQRFDLDFCWVPLDRLKNGLNLYPPQLTPVILEDKRRFLTLFMMSSGVRRRYEEGIIGCPIGASKIKAKLYFCR